MTATHTYGMYSEAGNAAVERHIIVPTVRLINDGLKDRTHKAVIRSEAAGAVRSGTEVVAARHREVHDTDVREQVYGFIGSVLISTGLATDRWNWDAE